MFQVDPNVALPSPEELLKVNLRTLVKTYVPTTSQAKALAMPKDVFECVRDAWLKFEGPVRSLRRFRMSVPLHEGKAGFVMAYVEYVASKCILGIEVVPYEDEDDLDWQDLPDVMRYEAFDGDAPMMDKDWIDRHWTITKPVETISFKTRNKPKTRPNDPCPCGKSVNGKPVKFKKCCMFK